VIAAFSHTSARPGRPGWQRPAAALAALVAVLSVGAAAACGKKGPPLPPLVRLPSAPAAIEAARRGSAVDVQFVVPSANTDGSRPANIERVDVYAMDGAGATPAAEAEVLKAGTRVGTVAVKAPRDPDATIDPGDPDDDLEPLQGPGLDQGAPAHVRELLPNAAVAAAETTRTYVGVGISTRGRRGPVSKAAAVLLGAAPETPAQPTVTYTESAITITWEPVTTETGTVSYHVYDVSARAANPDGSQRATPDELRLTDAPISDPSFADKRIEWNVDRCYTVRAVRRLNELGVEGDAAPARCERLVDTFPPAPPTGLTAVASEGEISLIWTPSTEADLAGYRVLRAAAPSTELQPITAETLTESTYTDTVQADTRYVYAVVAVDTAGNASAPSERVEETAR
jgi:Fibronectin type III domain